MPKGIYKHQLCLEVTKEKMRLSHLGKHHSEETKEKDRQSHLGKKYPKELYPNYGWRIRKDKTYEKLYGIERAKQIKGKQSKTKRGKKFTEEHKKNISLGKIGHKLTEEHKKKLSISHKGKMLGETNPRYTGYIHKRYKIKMIEWLAIRQLILERDNFTCQKCGKTHHEVRLDVHHKNPFKISQDNSKENLITYCRSCHQKIETEIIKKLKEVDILCHLIQKKIETIKYIK